MASPEEIAENALWNTRNGGYIVIVNQTDDFQTLVRYARKEPTDWLTTTAREIVTQCWDQLGMYRLSSRLATLQIGRAQLDQIRRDTAQPDGADGLKLIQARAGLALQCAVVEVRRNEPAAREVALKLLDELISVLRRYQETRDLTLQILNWIVFWRGRILSTSVLSHDAPAMEATVRQAEAAFRSALEMADRNLKVKLERDRRDEVRRNHQIAATNYLISAVLGFGQAHLQQRHGRNEESLNYLKIAIPLARCNADYFRQGNLNFMAGIALRSLSQKSVMDMDPGEAGRHLQLAYLYFGGKDKETLRLLEKLGDFDKKIDGAVKIPPHHMYLARTLHQLALLFLNSGGNTLERSKLAWTLNEKALIESNHPDCREFRDPMLDYGVLVVRSLTASNLAEYGKGDYRQARSDADRAIRMLADGRIPRWMHGSCYVARGRAISEGAGQIPDGKSVAEAVRSWEQATDEGIRATERTLAHLYLARLHSRTSEAFRAGVHYDQAKALEDQCEHGWVRRLAEQVGTELGELKTAFVRVNVAQELAQLIVAKSGQKKSDIWKELSEHVLDQLRGEVLRVYRDELASEGGVSRVAGKLGVSPAAIYGWRGDKKYAHLNLARRSPRRRVTS